MENIENIQKEEFRAGIKDEDIISLFKKWKDETDEYFNTLKDIQNRNIEYYKGNQTDKNNILGKNSRAVENRVFTGIETIVPITTARPPEALVSPTGDNELSQKKAEKLQKVLQYHYWRTKLKEKSERWVRDLLLKRLGVFKIVWDDKIDDFNVKVIDPRRIRFSKYGQSTEELPYLIEELELSYQGVKDFFGEKIADDLLKEKSTGAESDEIKKRKTNFTIWEVWTNEFVAWIADDKILKKQDNPFYKEGENYLNFPQKPYIIRSLFQTEEYLLGDTDLVEQTLPIQDNINKRKRQIENLSSKVANPPLLVDDSVMDEETVQNITNEEGLILYGKDVANANKLRYETPGQVPSYLFDDYLSSKSEFDNIFGAHSTTRGEKSQAPTLGQDVLQRQADLGRIDLVTRQLERAFEDLFKYETQVMRVFYEDKKIIALLGDSGMEIIEFNKEDIEEKADIIVKAGTTLPTDEVSRRQEAINLFQLGALDPLSLYEYMKFPNPQKTFERLAKFRTGQMFAEYTGTGALPAQSGTSGAMNLGQTPASVGVSNQQGQTPAEAVQGRGESM